MLRVIEHVLLIACCGVLSPVAADDSVAPIPLIYSTDLHHPHVDPDDHFDLATLFSLPEFDVRGIVLDCGARQRKAPGEIPVRQMLRITGLSVPYAIGLADPLSGPEDKGIEQPAEFQKAVNMMLDLLRQSSAPVTVFTTGSVRDVAAAFNRDPALCREKIGRLYVNIGNPASGETLDKDEYNVALDRAAYLCVMNSGLPVYWCPCFDGALWERGRTGTFWKFTQREVLESAPPAVQNFFIFALIKPNADPLQFLGETQDSQARMTVWSMSRNMWCTAPLLHAAGRKIYANGTENWTALNPRVAKQLGLADGEQDVFGFARVRLNASRNQSGAIAAKAVSDEQGTAHVFESHCDQYQQVMTRCLRNLYQAMPR